MLRAGVLGLGPPVLGVDPGTQKIGLCLMLPSGEIARSETLKASGDDAFTRISRLAGVVHRAFDGIEADLGGVAPVVAIEEGIFAGPSIHAKVVGQLGEIRGVLMADAWARGWRVMKVAVKSWKGRLDQNERRMPKDQAYVTYWSVSYGREFSSPDSVDAAHIASYAVQGVS
jgi:Holliday junction resolvasome RuvABC endonuclease subunit